MLWHEGDMKTLLTAVSGTHGTIGCAMHARGCAVVVSYGVEAHVL